MSQSPRLEELYSYQLLDTPPEEELDELVQIASAICDTPVALISLMEENRQWFKAREGFDEVETSMEVSFCKYTLDHPDDLLIVEDPTKDERFKNNPLVVGPPNVRFYAGAPLVSPNGHVLGTLCVLDSVPQVLGPKKQDALRMLSRRVMRIFNTRKLVLEQKQEVERSVEKLKRLTDLAPGAIYQCEMTPEGGISFPFISKGITQLHPSLHPEEVMVNAQIVFSILHPDDLQAVNESIAVAFQSLEPWHMEYRVVMPDGSIRWHMGNSVPEPKANGNVVWYGIFQDITPRVEYEKAMEKIAFDISHVLRKPVSTLLGLTNIILDKGLDPAEIRKFASLIQGTSKELDLLTRELNETYQLEVAKAV